MSFFKTLFNAKDSGTTPSSSSSIKRPPGPDLYKPNDDLSEGNQDSSQRRDSELGGGVGGKFIPPKLPSSTIRKYPPPPQSDPLPPPTASASSVAAESQGFGNMFAGLSLSGAVGAGTSPITPNPNPPSNAAAVVVEETKESAFSFLGQPVQDTRQEQSAFGFISSADADADTLDEHKDVPDHSYSRDSVPAKQAEAQIAKLPKVIVDKADEIKHVTESLEENLDSIESAFEQAMQVHWSKIKRLNESESRVRVEEDAKKKQIENAEKELHVVEEMQFQAVENEEYELAESLNAKIEELKQKISGIRSSILNSFSNAGKISDERELLTRNSVSFVVNFIENLKEIRNGNYSVFRENIQEETNSIIAEEDALVALLTRAQQVLDHVRNDLEEVDSQHDMIDQEIKVKTASVQAEKDQLLEKHQLLEMERDDLLEKLKAKEKEIEACNSEINVKQKEIDKAYVFFERDLRKLKETRERILLDQENRQKEHNDLTLKKMSLEHRKQLLEDQDVKFTDLLSLLDQKILNAESTASRLEKYNMGRKVLTLTYEKIRSELVVLQSKKKECQVNIESLTQKINQSEIEVIRSNQEIASIDNKLPSLEIEKKSAALSKNFKKAAQVSKDMKDLETRKIELEGFISQYASELETFKQEVEHMQKELESIEVQLSQKAVEADKETFQVLILKRREISLLLDECKLSSIDQSSEEALLAIELNDIVSVLSNLSQKYQWDISEPADSQEENIAEVDHAVNSNDKVQASSFGFIAENRSSTSSEDLQRKIIDIQSELDECSQEVSMIDQKLLALALEKKAAVAEKKFKIAAEVSSNIKLLEEKRTDALLSAKSFEEELLTLQAELEELRAQEEEEEDTRQNDDVREELESKSVEITVETSEVNTNLQESVVGASDELQVPSESHQANEELNTNPENLDQNESTSEIGQTNEDEKVDENEKETSPED